MQVTTGTNKLFDPLNGLFGISTRIYEMLEAKSYPKRYGYPYFITVSAIINLGLFLVLILNKFINLFVL